MPLYLVERILPGATMEQVEGLHATLEHACSLAREHGTAITYLRSVFTPGESRCRCLFAAPSAEAVRELNDAGGLPYSRIVVAVELLGGAMPSFPVALPETKLSIHPVHETKERSK
jgi:hypothetical protein